jgi:hypothetical protein
MAANAKYGKTHQTLRANWQRVLDSGRPVACWRCKRPIVPGEAWHLGHSDDGSRHMGPEHAGCNLRAQNELRAARARAFVNGEQAVGESDRWSEHWYGGEDSRCPACRAAGGPCPDADVSPPADGADAQLGGPTYERPDSPGVIFRDW